MKRTTLLRNLGVIIERMPKLDLPAKIVAVYAFGGILREKRKLHDFDLVFLYTMTEDQRLRWRRFQDNFSTHRLESNEWRFPLADLKTTFAPSMRQGISLEKAVNDERVATVLKQKGVPPSWAGCFSWTELFKGHHGDGIFYPDLDRITRRMLIGKRVKGLQAQIQSYDDFINRRTWLVAKNYVLAWSPENPNIEENIEDRSPQERINTIIKEVDFFINDQIPQLRDGSDHSSGYLKVKMEVSRSSAEAGINIDLDALDRQHSEIRRIGNESHEELLQKCELARDEMRKYQTETIVLQAIACTLENWKEWRGRSSFQHRQAKEYIAQMVIMGVRKSDVSENDIRHILRAVGLPENSVIKIKRYGSTYYRLPENEEDRKRLLKESEVQKVKRKYLLEIMKAIKPFEKDARAELDLTDNGDPRLLFITIWKEINPNEETERKTIIENMEAKNFRVKNWSWAIEGTKQVRLTGKEDLNRLREIAKSMMTNPKLKDDLKKNTGTHI